MPDIKVFIGTEPKTEIARKVLQHSIQRRTASIGNTQQKVFKSVQVSRCADG